VKEDRQCTYSITPRCGHISIVRQSVLHRDVSYALREGKLSFVHITVNISISVGCVVMWPSVFCVICFIIINIRVGCLMSRSPVFL
jgi:hypothetical protein